MVLAEVVTIVPVVIMVSALKFTATFEEAIEWQVFMRCCCCFFSLKIQAMTVKRTVLEAMPVMWKTVKAIQMVCKT